MNEPTIAEIQARVARRFNMAPIEMLSERRSMAVAHPRQVAMYLARELTTRSLPIIGRHFGGRDHTTVIHAIKAVEQRRLDRPELDRTIRDLLDELTPHVVDEGQGNLFEAAA